MLYHNT